MQNAPYLSLGIYYMIFIEKNKTGLIFSDRYKPKTSVVVMAAARQYFLINKYVFPSHSTLKIEFKFTGINLKCTC